MPRVHQQDPDEKQNYAIDYSERLPTGDNIASTIWTSPVLTASTPSFTGQSATVILTGGVAGTDYVIHNRSTSVAGLIVEDYIVIQVRSSS